MVSAGEDVILYADTSRQRELRRFHFLRQQKEKSEGQYNYSLADFIAPLESGLTDWIGMFAVTSGHGLSSALQRFYADLDDYSAILLEALADRLAEAYAEALHREVRKVWGYGRDENLTPQDLIREKYRGIRPAPGYPACPDHSEKLEMFELLGVEKNAGICLTENFAMIPGSSVCGFYFAHPAARYFPVGKLNKDQVADYASRRGISLEQAEQWLAASLNYS